MTNPKTGSQETPSECRRHDFNFKVGPSVDADIASNEGEIKDDNPVSADIATNQHDHGEIGEKSAFRDQSESRRRSFSTIFRCQDTSYLLEFWFIAPFKASDSRRNFLRHLTGSITHRH